MLLRNSNNEITHNVITKINEITLMALSKNDNT